MKVRLFKFLKEPCQAFPILFTSFAARVAFQKLAFIEVFYFYLLEILIIVKFMIQFIFVWNFFFFKVIF
jgi:hypothetical protein